jgi:hypothetical protein
VRFVNLRGSHRSRLPSRNRRRPSTRCRDAAYTAAFAPVETSANVSLVPDSVSNSSDAFAVTTPRLPAPIYWAHLVSKLSADGWPKAIGRGFRVPHIIPVGREPGHSRGRRTPAAP